MKKILCLLLSLLMLLGAVSALAEDVILIGGIAPLTGPASVYGIAVKNAADLYVKQLNDNGGLLGKKVKIEWLDDKHEPTEAINAYNKLINMDGIAAIFGPVTSAPVLAVLDLAVEDGIPLLTSTGTADAITEVVNANIFRSCFKDSFQGVVMASFAANSLGAKKVAVLYDNTSDYSSGIAENFKEKAAEYGMEILAYEACVAGSGDFKSQLTNIAATKPETLFVPMYYSDVSLIVQQAHEVGIECVLLGVDGWDGVLGVIEDASLLEGYYFCNNYAADEATDTLVAFVEQFEAEYKEVPNSFAALGYDGIAVILNAIEAAGSTDWAAVAAEMAKGTMVGVTGTLTYEGPGDPAGREGVINIITGGEQKFVERVAP